MLHDVATLLTEKDAAQFLRLSPATLRNMRPKGRGPLYIKVGSIVRYRYADLMTWIESRVRHTTDGVRTHVELAPSNNNDPKPPTAGRSSLRRLNQTRALSQASKAPRANGKWIT